MLDRSYRIGRISIRSGTIKRLKTFNLSSLVMLFKYDTIMGG
jgi:hypothetical protein